MTLIGKILVFLNLVFSLLMMGWAWAIYANNRGDSSGAAKGGLAGSELAARKTTLGDLQLSMGSAELAEREARARLLTWEAYRVPDRLWYLQEMDHLRTGATAERPARTVVFEGNLPALDPTNANRPRVAPATDRENRPLLSLDAYNRALETTRQQLAKARADYQLLLELDAKLTLELTGPEGMERRGLQGRLKFERTVKLPGVIEEENLVRPQLINSAVESQLVLRRQRSLERRLEELKKVGVAARRR